MRILIYTFCLMVFAGSSAQDPEALRKIEAAKIALITERLNLTPDQAEKFWPIYNEFFNRQKEVRREYTDMRRTVDPKTASEEQNKQLLELGMRVKENQLQLEREYSERLLKVISNRQMVNLRKAEEDFRKILMEKMRQRQMANQRKRNQNNQRLRNRNNN